MEMKQKKNRKETKEKQSENVYQCYRQKHKYQKNNLFFEKLHFNYGAWP